MNDLQKYSTEQLEEELARRQLRCEVCEAPAQWEGWRSNGVMSHLAQVCEAHKVLLKGYRKDDIDLLLGVQ